MESSYIAPMYVKDTGYNSKFDMASPWIQISQRLLASKVQEPGTKHSSSQPLIAIEERNDNLGKECGDTKNSGNLYFYIFCVNTGAVKEDLVSTVTSLDSFIIIRDGAAAAVYGDVLDDYDEAGGDDQIVGDVSN